MQVGLQFTSARSNSSRSSPASTVSSSSKKPGLVRQMAKEIEKGLQKFFPKRNKSLPKHDDVITADESQQQQQPLSSSVKSIVGKFDYSPLSSPSRPPRHITSSESRDMTSLVAPKPYRPRATMKSPVRRTQSDISSIERPLRFFRRLSRTNRQQMSNSRSVPELNVSSKSPLTPSDLWNPTADDSAFQPVRSRIQTIEQSRDPTTGGVARSSSNPTRRIVRKRTSFRVKDKQASLARSHSTSWLQGKVAFV